MQGQSPEAAIHLAHHDHYSDRLLRMILRNVRTFAMVGASAVWSRPSFYAMKYLQKRGFRVIPVNPARAGEEILGEIVYATIKDVPVQVDMVDIFRTSEEAFEITKGSKCCGCSFRFAMTRQLSLPRTRA